MLFCLYNIIKKAGDFIGELKKYKIGEVARLAGVSRRTVDYYTKLGLLKPVKFENNYRYYSGEALIRLKLIEGMKEKKKKLTLEEIRERLRLLDDYMPGLDGENKYSCISIGILKEQVKQLEERLSQLQPALAGLEKSQATQLTRQVFLQSLSIIQTLMLYIGEISPDITLFF